MKNRLSLIILAIKNNDMSVLLDRGKVLETTPGKDLIQSLQKLSQEYLELHTEWLNFRLFEVYKDNNTMYTCYSIRVPDIIKNKKGRWHNIGDINDIQAQKLVYAASLHK